MKINKKHILYLGVYLTFLICNCQTSDKKAKQFLLLGKINISTFYDKKIAKDFLNLTSNELGVHCPISFAIKDVYLYLPSPTNNSIKTYQIDKKKITFIKSLTTKYSPDFIEIDDDKQLYYSSYFKNGIFTLRNEFTFPFKSDVDVTFKKCNSSIIYNSRSWYHISESKDSAFYKNMYNDWDIFVTPNNEFVVFYLTHEDGEEESELFIEKLNAKLNNYKTKVDIDRQYDTHKILGIFENQLVFLSGNESKIELIYCDIKSLKIIKREKYNSPFKEELMMGVKTAYWPNQYVCKLYSGKVYLMGTSRQNIEFYSLNLN